MRNILQHVPCHRLSQPVNVIKAAAANRGSAPPNRTMGNSLSFKQYPLGVCGRCPMSDCACGLGLCWQFYKVKTSQSARCSQHCFHKVHTVLVPAAHQPPVGPRKYHLYLSTLVARIKLGCQALLDVLALQAALSCISSWPRRLHGGMLESQEMLADVAAVLAKGCCLLLLLPVFPGKDLHLKARCVCREAHTTRQPRIAILRFS